ncbi:MULTISPECIES: response regulator transcription factor [unclassified Paenibacillus]|uniref:response regulator transcription factor n=1 Tax=unclassified Paenibacillus TaxID=185978 RepID=UPI003645F02F
MLRVLIADDEPLFRIAMREMIRWEHYDCEIVAEVSNGGEALRYMERHPVDIVIMDVQMPVLNGIAFLEQLKEREEKHKPMVIVLSAYSNYNYVRKAFLLGASDYIVKEDLEESVVTPVIAKAVAKRKEHMQETEQQLQESKIQQKRMKEQALLLTLNHAVEDEGLPEEQIRMIREWRAESSQSRQILISIWIDRTFSEESKDLDSQKLRYISITIMQVLEANYPESVIVPFNKAEFAILVVYPVNESVQHTRHRIIETVNTISNHLRQYLNISVSMGVSLPCAGWTQWSEHYDAARQLAALRLYNGLGHAYFPEDSPFKSSQSSVSPLCSTGELLYKLEMGTADWKGEFDKWIQAVKSIGVVDAEIIFQQYKSLLRELSMLIHAKGFTWPDILDLADSPYEQLEQLEWMPRIHDWLRAVLHKIYNVLDSGRKAADSIPRLIDKAKKLIERHYAAPISLSLVSQQVGVSESYLSKVFVKDTGENFSEYVTRFRIEKAKQMLYSGMKIYEVGESVGYPNQTHFSRIFKKVTGKTPLEFKSGK